MSIPLDIMSEVQTVVDDLEAHGYECVDEQYDENAFGNALLCFERNGTRVRLVRDRSQWFIEAGPGGGIEWFAPVIWHIALVAPVSFEEAFSWPEQVEMLLADLNVIEKSIAARGSDLVNELLYVRERRAKARLDLPSS